MPLTVVCVNVGTKYHNEEVHRLRRMVEANLSPEHRFVCVTDHNIEDVETRPAVEGLMGWWQKLALLRRDPYGITGRILYLDLDVLVTGSLDDIADFPSGFAMHRDFMKPLNHASAVMVFNAGARESVWAKFLARRDVYLGRYHGDQDVISALAPDIDVLPRDWVVSYRLQSVNGPPPNARVVCFHGTPKPGDIPRGWVKETRNLYGETVAV